MADCGYALLAFIFGGIMLIEFAYITLKDLVLEAMHYHENEKSDPIEKPKTDVEDDFKRFP